VSDGEVSVQPGDIISYMEMCRQEGVSLQRGMNFRLGGRTSLILMSVRIGAPYADKIENGGRILIYEGHDVPRTKGCPNPKRVDQSGTTPSGALTQNGLFFQAALEHKSNGAPAELVKVYEKIKTGIWAYAGLFDLTDSWIQKEGGRKVFKFKLQVSDRQLEPTARQIDQTDHVRFIPTQVKVEVWKRDKGKCVLCGSKQNLHFDHIVPFSKGGTSLLAQNIQLLCAKHNLGKRDRIQ